MTKNETSIAPRYLRPEATAQYLGGISLRHLRDLMAEKVLPFIKIGRTVLFDIHDLDKALTHFKRNAGAAAA